ncbi:putative tetratricopeptide-like helical domain superfamily [Helianthus anomalus]
MYDLRHKKPRVMATTDHQLQYNKNMVTTSDSNEPSTRDHYRFECLSAIKTLYYVIRNLGCYKAWSLFSEMRNFGFFPTQCTYGSLFSCNSLDVVQGLYMQEVAMKSGFLFADAFVGTASLGFFGRQGCINEAFKVFDDMPFKILVTYNAMISLFGHEGFVHECMLIFRELLKSHILLSEPSFVGVLSGFRSEDDLDSGEQLHGLVIKFGLLSKVSVANSLVNMYGKCAGTYLTEKMFSLVPNRYLVTWNTVIGALAYGEEPIKAIEVFCRMYIDGFLPNRTTFLNAITSYTV